MSKSKKSPAKPKKLTKRALKALTKMSAANISRQANIASVVKQVLGTVSDTKLRATLNGPVTGLTFALDRANGSVDLNTVKARINGLSVDEIRDVVVLVNLAAADASVEANIASLVKA